LPKPKGTIGGTKMKIMALICNNSDCGMESYGYNIWQSLKSNFHIYLNDNDIRNVYHHLRGLCELDLLSTKISAISEYRSKELRQHIVLIDSSHIPNT
jgi:hypothetical protein